MATRRITSGECVTCLGIGTISEPDYSTPNCALKRKVCIDCKGSGRCRLEEEWDSHGNLINRKAIPI